MRYACRLVLILLFPPLMLNAQPRIEKNISADWKFLRADAPGAEKLSHAPAGWLPVTIPHTWNAFDGEDGGNNYYRGAGWYFREFRLEPEWKSRSIYLKFDGVSMAAQVFVNGLPAGVHRGAFAAFCFDVTGKVRFDTVNTLAVRVSNARDTTIAPLSGDFTVFGGIYRGVRLIILNDLSISPIDDASSGVYIMQTSVNRDEAEIEVTTVVRNNVPAARDALLRWTVVDPSGSVAAAAESLVRIGGRNQQRIAQQLRIRRARLWQGRDDPALYEMHVEVLEAGRLQDSLSEHFGLRSFSVDPDRGFFLNGVPYALHGVNRHQDRLDRGWAIGPEDHREDFALIEEMGCSAVRLAHYQHAQEFYDLCDRGGIVVWAELALVDQVGASASFEENCRQQLRELIKQNFNHPSIIFWSLSNELIPTPDRPLYARITRDLNALAKELDPSRLTTLASRSMFDGNEEINTVTDVIGYNVYKGWYEGNPGDFASYVDSLHRRFPQRAFCISEYGAGAGIHQHELPAVHPEPGGPWHPEEWQAEMHEAAWKIFAPRPFLWGTFVWNMFDFASDGRSEGELPGRNDKGLVTYDRKVRKDAFCWYKAHWNREPMVHITGARYEVRPPGPTEIKVYSNCDIVELFVGSTSLGVCEPDDTICRWRGVDLAPGANVVRAVARAGERVVEDSCVLTGSGS